MSGQQLQQCIDLCSECSDVCQETFANHCLEVGGEHVEQSHARLMLDCAQICRTAADFMIRNSRYHSFVCGTCAEICEACADSCAEMDTPEMKRCAEIFRRCAEECREMSRLREAA